MAYRINEGATLLVVLEYRDDADAAFTPAEVRYRLDSLTTRENLVPWTSVSSLSTTNTIVITATLNTLAHTKSIDERQVVVETTDDDGYKAVDTFDYEITNLFGVS